MPVQTKSEVIALLTKHSDTIRGFGVERCGVFGSFVRDEVRPDSDVDVLVAFEPKQTIVDNYMGLSFFPGRGV